MSANQKSVFAVNRAYSLTNYNIHDNIHKQYEVQKQIILSDKSLTIEEKSESMFILTLSYNKVKIVYNEGTKRICENCFHKYLATLYCEYCIRKYLMKEFSNWTSGDVCVDSLIRNCQINTYTPNDIVEWIPYENLKNIEYLTKGGCSEIYTAKNVENTSQNWFEEVKSHLTISNKWAEAVVKCYGLTRDPLNGVYLLVMQYMNIDLREYLQQNHHLLTWKERIQISTDIILALMRIHNENAIHRDLHSGNILFKSKFNIGDFGFCGPADKPLKSYCSSGQPPFINHDHDYDLVMRIINDKIDDLNLFYQNNLKISNYTCSRLSPTSKVHHFTNLHEPKNSIEALRSNNQYYFNNYNEIHNNPNLHSKEQNELELPDSKNLLL
ncbi:kinase-like domain-containing protein [Rhizophagus clarus]|uniref:Kinase-like domain-containing protein n=1 Tax=Rhizophagus clarus TaxID=94130 RepID=A0A8H3KSP7_9GLOM|nr:kinase-like domain-containing protein [Rhizophagus clarus]